MEKTIKKEATDNLFEGMKVCSDAIPTDESAISVKATDVIVKCTSPADRMEENVIQKGDAPPDHAESSISTQKSAPFPTCTSSIRRLLADSNHHDHHYDKKLVTRENHSHMSDKHDKILLKGSLHDHPYDQTPTAANHRDHPYDQTLVSADRHDHPYDQTPVTGDLRDLCDHPNGQAFGKWTCVNNVCLPIENSSNGDAETGFAVCDEDVKTSLEAPVDGMWAEIPGDSPMVDISVPMSGPPRRPDHVYCSLDRAVPTAAGRRKKLRQVDHAYSSDPVIRDDLSDAANPSTSMTGRRKKKKRLVYAGDCYPDDSDSPTRTKAKLAIAVREVKASRKKIKLLMQKNRRLLKRLKTLEKTVENLKESTISEKAVDFLNNLKKHNKDVQCYFMNMDL